MRISSAAVGRAVSTASSEYTCIESALMMKPRRFSANSIAKRDLPLAVGPAISTASRDIPLPSSNEREVLPRPPHDEEFSLSPPPGITGRTVPAQFSYVLNVAAGARAIAEDTARVIQETCGNAAQTA